MEIKSKLQTFIESRIKEPWLDEDKEIAPEILEDIDENLKPLRMVIEMLENEIERVEKNVKEKDKQRKEQRSTQIDQNNKRKSKLKENIEKVTGETVGKGEIKEIDNNQTFVLDGFSESRIIKNNSKISLDKYTYHLAVLENSGKMFWLRPSETRITQFRWKLKLPLTVKGSKYEVSFFTPSIWKGYFGQIDPLTNLSITLSPSNFEYPICNISAWFDLETLEIFNIKTLSEESIRIISSNYGSNFSDPLRDIEKWILENEKEFSSEIIKLLLNPKYEKKLESEDITYFLRPDEKYELKLGKIEDKPILIFKNLSS